MANLYVCRNSKDCKYEGYCVHKKPHPKQKTIVHNNFNEHYRISNCINNNECEAVKHALCIPVAKKKAKFSNYVLAKEIYRELENAVNVRYEEYYAISKTRILKLLRGAK